MAAVSSKSTAVPLNTHVILTLLIGQAFFLTVALSLLYVVGNTLFLI
jgi:hypothetical protein